MSRGERGETIPDEGPVERLPQTTPPSSSVHSHDLVRRVETALGRFGAPGIIERQGDFLFLRQGAVQTRAPVGAWLEAWSGLDSETKNRVATDLARELRQSRPPSTLPRRGRRLGLVLDGRMLAVAALVLGLFGYVWFADRSGANAPAGEVAPPQQSGVRIEQAHAATSKATPTSRASHSCAVTLSRVLRGGGITPADAEGWQVEIVLLKAGSAEPLAAHPALREFVGDPKAPGGSKFIWANLPSLGHVDTPDTLVAVRRAPLESPEAGGMAGVTLTFSGTYVDDYLSEGTRPHFHAIASALSASLDASHGAVYAKCFDSRIHTMGSWFRGLDVPSVVTALVYFIGAFSNPPHLAEPFLHSPAATQLEPPHIWSTIAHRARHLNRTDLSTLVGSEGGMALGQAEEAVILLFPFSDGNRASRVSRSAARVLNLAASHP